MANEFARNRKDEHSTMKITRALPNGTATVNSDSFDLGADSAKTGGYELQLEMPSLSSTQVPNTRTISVSLEDSADDSSFSAIQTNVKVVTGTGSTLAASTTRIALPSSVRRYARLSFAGGASLGDCSASSATIRLVF